jgi:hypothetical protein
MNGCIVAVIYRSHAELHARAVSDFRVRSVKMMQRKKLGNSSSAVIQ